MSELVRVDEYLSRALEALGDGMMDETGEAIQTARNYLSRLWSSSRDGAPEVGALRTCLVCSREKPWGIFCERTGAVVCVDCRDAGQVLAREESATMSKGERAKKIVDMLMRGSVRAGPQGLTFTETNPIREQGRSETQVALGPQDLGVQTCPECGCSKESGEGSRDGAGVKAVAREIDAAIHEHLTGSPDGIAVNDDATVSVIVPILTRFASSLESARARAEADLEHCRSQAGEDSCADLALRCQRAEAERDKYERGWVAARTALNDKSAEAARLREAVQPLMDLLRQHEAATGPGMRVGHATLTPSMAKHARRIREALSGPGAKSLPERPSVVCLCGSTRFVETFNEWRKRLTYEGCIVLSIEIVTTQSRAENPQHVDPEAKARLDELHLRKIDMADEVLVLNVGGYIGESTRKEIEYAERTGKPVRYLEGPGAKGGGEG